MRESETHQHRVILQQIARRAMVERGLLPDFSREAMAEVDGLRGPSVDGGGSPRDLRHLAWCSIDNDDSRDLDQLTTAEALGDGGAKISVAVADVDSLVRRRGAIDAHAQHNTTSVYTAAEVFPMLPEKLSTDLTSLGFQEERRALVAEIIVDADGALQSAEVYEAVVFNRAKLAYDSVAAWLADGSPPPDALRAVDGLEENLRVQDRMAQRLKARRREQGALEFDTVEARPVFEGDRLRDLRAAKTNRARDLIEDFMIAANGVVVRHLAAKKLPSLRRVVRQPKRWDRIVELAAERQVRLPAEPDPRALERFLAAARAADPMRFPDLSLSVIKLLGAGEYVVELPGEKPIGHFGLAVKDYGHSTAPNRRYPDLITQRLLKASIRGTPAPYGVDELNALAEHCTEAEDSVKKIERQVEKSTAAVLLESRIGDRFDAIVTGASEKGTWVRLFHPPIEGKLVQGFQGADVGHQLRVELIHVDVERGFIDFKRTR